MSDEDARHLLEQAKADARLLTVKEYADARGVTSRTVWRWIREGKIRVERTVEPNGRYRIRSTRAA